MVGEKYRRSERMDHVYFDCIKSRFRLKFTQVRYVFTYLNKTNAESVFTFSAIYQRRKNLGYMYMFTWQATRIAVKIIQVLFKYVIRKWSFLSKNKRVGLYLSAFVDENT